MGIRLNLLVVSDHTHLDLTEQINLDFKMKKENYNFFILLKVLLARLFRGRVHFSKKYVGKLLSMEDGKKFQVIRDLKVDPEQSPEKSVAVFLPCT